MGNEDQGNDTDGDDTSGGADGPSVPADEPKICAHCGTLIDTEEWHPILSRTDDDGVFRVYAFCSEDCRDEWKADTE